MINLLKTKKGKIIFSISVITLTLIIGFVSVFAYYSYNNKPSNYEVNTKESYDYLATNGSAHVMASSMAISSASFFEATSSNKTFTTTLIATVLPESAENREVTWSLSWATDAPLKTKALSEYITGVTDANNSRRFTITVTKPFLGSNIIVTARTSNNKATSCKIIFKGLATSISVLDYDNATLTSTTARGQYYAIPKNTTATFDLGANNEWGVLGETSYVVDVYASSQLYQGDYSHNQDDNNLSWSNVSLQNVDIGKYIIASINDDVLSVSMKKYGFEDIVANEASLISQGLATLKDNGRYTFCNCFYYNYVNGVMESGFDAQTLANLELLSKFKFNVRVKEVNSGKIMILPVYFGNTVQSIDIGGDIYVN